jgi:hypothetical protein
MGGLADRIRYALANPLRDDHAIDPMRELAELLREVGLEPESGGGAVTFAGRDPIETSFLAGRDVARPAHLGGQLDRHHLAGDEPIKQVAIAARRFPQHQPAWAKVRSSSAAPAGSSHSSPDRHDRRINNERSQDCGVGWRDHAADTRVRHDVVTPKLPGRTSESPKAFL